MCKTYAHYLAWMSGCRCANMDAMLSPCPGCDHTLWTEVGTIGAFRLVVFFDDERASDTYAEQVDRCPGCGLWLHGLDIAPADVARLGTAQELRALDLKRASAS